MRKTIIMAVIIAVSSAVGFASCKKEKNNVTPATTGTQVIILSETERNALVFTREEEKMARDVYNVLLNKWNIDIFSNISGSEQKHMDAIAGLLTTYNVTDPVGSNAPGVFTNADIQQLYNDLTAKGTVSETEAMLTGLTIEDMDISDLQNAIQQTDKQDIKTVYENLMRASKNHMREFYSQLQSRGGSYTPQYITQQQYNEIVNSPKEHGGTNASAQ